MPHDVISLGNRAAGDTDDGNPVKIGGVAMTTNPTKVADAKRANLRTDAIGRGLFVPYQVRELVSTARATLTRISETTVMSGVAATFLDVLNITGVNSTAVAAQIDIRAATGGGIIDTLLIPANSVATKQYQVPLPQDELAAAWTAQWSNSTGEISDSPIIIAMEAVKNI